MLPGDGRSSRPIFRRITDHVHRIENPQWRAMRTEDKIRLKQVKRLGVRSLFPRIALFSQKSEEQILDVFRKVMITLLAMGLVLGMADRHLVGLRSVEAQTGGNLAYLPIIVNTQPPISTTSWYMKTVDFNTLAVMGCGYGIHDNELPGIQNSITVLDFGTPTFDDGAYGATIFGFGPADTGQIAVAVEAFAWGYYACLGNDSASQMLIAVGTNNYFGGDVTFEHGQAWALMVNEINQWILDNGYSAQVRAAGASDMEIGWNSPETTRLWVNGYDSANSWPLYNFGDAAGCPPAGSSCGSSAFPEWTQEDVWYISWGAPPSIPTPLIYANSGIHAEQWYQLSVYSVENHGFPMIFAAAITQYQACLQRPSWICDLLDNTAAEGWNQLWSQLNSDPRTAQDLPWVTDFKWYGE